MCPSNRGRLTTTRSEGRHRGVLIQHYPCFHYSFNPHLASLGDVGVYGDSYREGGWVEQRIFLIINQKVMIDRDLAELYGVETKYLNRQVKRNLDRFPAEFMFQLTSKERNELVTICHRFKTMKHSRSMPYAFNEHGVAMLASVLKSERAVKISINIIKTFVKLRELLSTNKELAHKLKHLEGKFGQHDEEIQLIFKAIRQLMKPPETKNRKIGFKRI